MGAFKDLHHLAKQNMARVDAEMDAMEVVSPEQVRAPSIPADDAIDARAMVVRFTPTDVVADIDPVVELELLVIAPGRVPRPVTIRPALPLGRTARVQCGTALSVTLSRADPTVATINWPPGP
jgi:hypothetical protein